MTRSIPKRSAHRINTSIRFSGVSPGTEWRWLWMSQIRKRRDWIGSPSSSPSAPPAQNKLRRPRRLNIELLDMHKPPWGRHLGGEPACGRLFAHRAEKKARSKRACRQNASPTLEHHGSPKLKILE